MRTITIKRGAMGRFDDGSPFLVEAGRLELKIELPDEAGEFYLVAENGKHKRIFAISRAGTITLDGLTAGELKAEVKQYLRGTLVKAYRIEPLIIKEVDAELSATPEIAELNRKIEVLTDKTKEFAETLKAEAEARIAAERRCSAALLAYAYAAYQDDVRLNSKSLSFEDFAAALGISVGVFDEDEIEAIKTLKEEL